MSSSAPSSAAASSPAPDRPASGPAPASPVSTRPPASASPEVAAAIGLHDTQLEASPASLASGPADGLSPAAGALSSEIAHRNELPAELDAPAPHDHLHAVSAGEESELESEVEPIDAADNDGATLASAGESSTDSEDELPTLDAATLAHFVAIQGALTFREGMLARALAAELSPAELRAWMTELRQLSVAEAAARIRSVLADAADDGAAGGGS